MPFVVKAQVTGLGKVLAALADLKQGARNRILRKALAAGAKPMLARAKQLAPSETGLLRRSLRTVIYTEGGKVIAEIGPKSMKEQVVIEEGQSARILSKKGRKGLLTTADTPAGSVTRNRNPAYYAHLVEFGRVAVKPVSRKALSSGAAVFASAGPMTPRPFLRPAFDETQAQARQIIADTVWQELGKLARKRAA